jgi:hypothetical protein
MRAFVVVVVDPSIQISLQRLEFLVNVLAESDFVELLFNRSVDAFADAVGFWTLSFRPRVFDVVDRREQLVVMPLETTTELGAAIRQDSDEVDAIFLQHR